MNGMLPMGATLARFISVIGSKRSALVRVARWMTLQKYFGYLE